MTTRIGHICAYCGSSDVLMDAWAEWDSDRQDWVLHDVATAAFCRRCDGDTRLVEVELVQTD